MYCPNCGSEAGDSKYCPECGTDLSAVRGAVRGAKSGPKGGAKKAGANLGPQPRATPGRGPSAAVLWGGIAVVAAIVVALVLVFAGGSGDKTPTNGDGTGTTPVQADTSGSYNELVQRANGLYDQGDAAFQQNDIEQGAQYFGAAAKVYEAAWKKQPGDPNVGTDWSTALFYSGDIDGAVKQVDVVLKANPDFQTGWFNKGNFLAHEARITEQMGDAKAAKKMYEDARQAYLKAVAIDPKSDVGKEADNRIKDLPT